MLIDESFRIADKQTFVICAMIALHRRAVTSSCTNVYRGLFSALTVNTLTVLLQLQRRISAALRARPVGITN